MKEAQATLSEREIVVNLGAGLVTVTLNGQTRISGHQSKCVSADDFKLLGNLSHLRLMTRTKNLEALKQESMGSFTQGLNLPPGFKFPFLMSVSPLLISLEQALRCLPRVGPRSASRMALHLLERDRQRGLHLAEILSEALDLIEHCEICSNLTEIQPCRICQDTARDQSLLCVVSSPSDIFLAIEQSGLFKGLYHCLAGL